MTTAQGPLDETLAHIGPYAGPLGRREEEDTLQLAFVAAGQMLPPRQRAVLLLRDVLDFSAREVAEMLETSVHAVNSALQRARATLGRERVAGTLAHPHAPASAAVERDLATRFARAWQASDVDALVRLLADDALLTMPPRPLRVVGAASVASFLRSGPLADAAGRFRVGQTRVNGQPALAIWRAAGAGGHPEPYAILTLSVAGERVASITRFAADAHLFRRLGLPVTSRV